MKSLIRELIKSTISLTVCVAMITGLMNTKVGLCSDRASQLGSAVAVGSPVLNQNFTTDDWNPYEMECFGVYLSNYVTPLIETYEEAFADGGDGYYALKMSTKNDPNSNKTLRGLTDFAVSHQLTAVEPLYIGYYSGTTDSIFTYDGEDSDAYSFDTKVPATLGSLYCYGFISRICNDDSGIHFMSNDLAASYLVSNITDFFEDTDPSDFPDVLNDVVFYKNVNGAEKIMFDTCSVFDSDALNALLATMYNSDKGNDFYQQYSSMFDSPLGVDAYGNIVLQQSGLMVFPACLNTHSTVDGCVNYVNRYMLNKYTANADIQTDPLVSDTFAAYVRNPIYTECINEYGWIGYPVNYDASNGATGMFYTTNVDIAMLTDQTPAQCFWTLATTDYDIGDAQHPLRFAMPISASKQNDAYDWSYFYEQKIDVEHGDPNLYFSIQGNYMRTELSLVSDGRSFGGACPPNTFFNEIYFPTENNKTTPLFVANSGAWEIIDGNLWTAGGSPLDLLKGVLTWVTKTDMGANTYSHGATDDQFFQKCEVNNAFINALGHALDGEIYTGDMNTMNTLAQNFIASQDGDGCSTLAGLCNYDGYYVNAPKVKVSRVHGGSDDVFFHADTNGSLTNAWELNEPLHAYYNGGDSKISAIMNHANLDYIAMSAGGTTGGALLAGGVCIATMASPPIGIGVCLIGVGVGGATVVAQTMDAYAGDPESLMITDTFYKIYQMDSSGYVSGMGSYMDNGLGAFDDAASYIYVTYLNWYGIGREEDAYGVKTAKSNFDPLFFASETVLVPNFDDLGTGGGVDEEGQEAAARQRVLTLLDAENGAEYRQQLVMNTFSSFLTNAYDKLAGKNLGSERNSTLSLQEVADNPFTAWMEDHSVWILLVFSFLAMICAIWTAIRRGKGFFWIICQITIGITAVVFIPVMLDAGIHFANGVAQKCYSSNADIWWLSDAVQSRQAELGLYDIYMENEESYEEAGMTMNVMANIVLGSETYQSVKFSQDISNKHTMKLTGLYASLSQYPSAAWILPTLLDESTVGDETTGYSVRVGAYKKLSELETLYWGYTGPVGVGDTETMLLLNGASLYPLTAAKDKQTTSDVGVTGVDGNVWYYNSYARCVPTNGVLTHTNTTLTGGVEANTSFLSSSVWLDDTNSKDKIYNIENLAVKSLSSAGRTPAAFCTFVGEDAPAFKAHEIVRENNEGAWYLTGTESPLAYFYMVMQDTFYNYNTSQTIDAMIGANIIYDVDDETQYSYNLSFLQATINGSYLPNAAPGQMAIDHHWDGTAVGTEYARDVLDLDYFFRYYAPTMYVASIYTGGSQIGLGNDTAVDGEDIVGHFGSAKVGDFWDYPIYEDNYAAWLYASNWAIKLYENPENIKLQTVRDSSGNKYTVCPINPETYPSSRPFVTCAAQMVAQGLNEGDLSTVEYICVQANDEAVRELIKTVNVYTNAPSKLDVNSFKDLLAVKCLTAFANSMNQACLMDATYRIIPNGFEFDNISFDTVFSQMLYNNYRKAHAYTVENVVKGYLMDEGPIMGTVLIFATLLGTTVIPFVLRIGVAILFVLNIWAALNGVAESLETRASVVIASLLNTASFAIRTTILFVVQAFLMSMGSAGLIKAKAEISFKGGATMMVVALCVFYIIYTISIIKFFVTSIQHGSDMGAAYLRANYELARDQGAIAFAKHRFAQSMGGKMLNAISKGKLANDVTMPSGGAGAGGQGGGKDDLKQSAGPDSEGSSRKGGSNSNGKKNIDDARDRSNKTLTQAADKLTAKGKDSASGGAYAKNYQKKGAEYAKQQADLKNKGTDKNKTPDGNEKSKSKSDNSDSKADKKSDKKDDKKDDDKTTKVKI